MPDISNSAQDVRIIDEATGYELKPNSNGSLQVAGAVTVSGASALGVAPALPPVAVSGVDGGGLKRHILLDTSGRVSSLVFDGSGNAINSQLVDGKQALDVANRSGNIPCYMSCTGTSVTTGTSINTTTSIAYLWHPSGVTKRYEISKIVAHISFYTGNDGRIKLALAKITAENGTPGGVSEVIQPLDGDDAASGGIFRVGANTPTRVTGEFSSKTVVIDNLVGSGAAGQGLILSFDVFDESILGKPLILRSGINEGFEIRTIITDAISNSGHVSSTFYWREV